MITTPEGVTRLDTRGNTIRVPKGKYTVAMLARKSGASPDTIRRWRARGYLPFEIQDNGELEVYLFGADALAEARRRTGWKRSGKKLNRRKVSTQAQRAA
jgi:hypothetical protein